MSSRTLPTDLKYRLLHAGGLQEGGAKAAAPAAAGGEKKADAKADKKDKKADAKEDAAAPAKKGGNARKQAALAALAASGSERKAPLVAHPLGDALFGDLERVQSAYNTDRKWVAIDTITEASIGQEVWVRARVHKSNTKGKTTFLALRRGFSSIQCVVERGTPEQKDKVTPEFQKFVEKINPESVVDVFARVTKAFKPVTSCSQSAVELQPIRFYVVSSSANVLPFQLEDAARPPGKHGTEGKGEEKDGVITVGTDLRLDNRVIDLRTPANHAIFRLQSRVCEFYRAYFISEGFVEIHTPKITPGVSEGGSDVFKLDYFGEEACLAQSPQLFKQMAVMSDLFKVFEIGHVFRAENSNTHRHMCEFIGLDFEMEIKESYRECTTVLGNCFNFIFDKINTHCQAELAAIQKQYPFEPLRYSKETLVLDFKEAMKMLRESGETIGDMDDFSTTQEKKLGKLVAAKYNTDFYIIDQYPITVRPFYTMPNKENPEYTNSYDVFVRGEEITSGAQRVHEVELLKERATAKGVPHDNITAYLEAFKFGAYPHGGAGIGLERVVMLFLGLDNIRKTSMFPRTPTRLSP